MTKFDDATELGSGQRCPCVDIAAHDDNPPDQNSCSTTTIDLFVPGRLCLFGEHSDWSGSMRKYNSAIQPGCTIVFGLANYGLHARASPLMLPLLRMSCTTDTGQRTTCELPLDETVLARTAQEGGFWSYVAGSAAIFATQFCVGGLEIDNYLTTLPLKKGLSSSAAVCVLVARAFNEVYHLGLTTRGVMQAAFEGERLTPSQCGRMDQALAFGSVPVVLRFDGDVLTVEPATLGGDDGLHLVLVDLRATKDTKKILSSLQAAFPHPQTTQDHALVALLGDFNLKTTQNALDALRNGDAARLGMLMNEAQAVFDASAGPMCPTQLGVKGSPVLHRILHHKPIQDLVYGGKGVGSQGDGSAQLLCKGIEAQARVCEILEHDFQVHCLKVDLLSTSSERKGTNGLTCDHSTAICSKSALVERVRRLEMQLEAARLDLELAQ